MAQAGQAGGDGLVLRVHRIHYKTQIQHALLERRLGLAVGLTREQVAQLAKNSFEGSFLSDADKKALEALMLKINQQMDEQRDDLRKIIQQMEESMQVVSQIMQGTADSMKQITGNIGKRAPV